MYSRLGISLRGWAMPAKQAFDASKYLTDLGGGEYLEVKGPPPRARPQPPDAVIETELVKYGAGLALFRARVTVPGGGGATGWGSAAAGGFGGVLGKAGGHRGG